MLRVVLDTNVFVSSLLSKTGSPAKVLEAWRGGTYLFITSPSIIAEIKTVLELPRIKKKYSIAQEDIEQIVNLLERDALVVPGRADVKNVIPVDPKDEMLLSCAMEAGAEFVVSGDKHLLDLYEYEGIPILQVRQFVERLAKEKML